ncbi:helix-turn-helix transcriptional regulator [Streptomyces sp. NPDC002784]
MPSEERVREQDAILAALAPVAGGLAATLGSFCEVVLHDFRRPERSVVAIAGLVTGRQVGGAMSEIGMGLVARGDEAADAAPVPTTTFGNDIDSVVDSLVDTHQLRQGKPWSALDRDERLRLFAALDADGVFAVRGVAQRVAERLGISRASAYTYLAQTRATAPTPPQDGTGRQHTHRNGERT